MTAISDEPRARLFSWRRRTVIVTLSSIDCESSQQPAAAASAASFSVSCTTLHYQDRTGLCSYVYVADSTGILGFLGKGREGKDRVPFSSNGFQGYRSDCTSMRSSHVSSSRPDGLGRGSLQGTCALGVAAIPRVSSGKLDPIA